MSVFDDGFAEDRREANDLWFGMPGYETEPPDDDRDDEEMDE
jgi:hypothetical protein